MRRTKKIVAVLAAGVFLVGCGAYKGSDVVPLDDVAPLPDCVLITFYEASNWDGNRSNKVAGTYCKEKSVDITRGD